MTKQELKQFGRDMIEAGQWSEYHKNKAKDEPMSPHCITHWSMSTYWEDKYDKMMKIYHEEAKKLWPDRYGGGS